MRVYMRVNIWADVCVTPPVETKDGFGSSVDWNVIV